MYILDMPLFNSPKDTSYILMNPSWCPTATHSPSGDRATHLTGPSFSSPRHCKGLPRWPDHTWIETMKHRVIYNIIYQQRYLFHSVNSPSLSIIEQSGVVRQSENWSGTLILWSSLTVMRFLPVGLKVSLLIGSEWPRTFPTFKRREIYNRWTCKVFMFFSSNAFSCCKLLNTCFNTELIEALPEFLSWTPRV